MGRKKDDKLWAGLMGYTRSWWRGREKNKYWGVILDCFDNLGFETKDGRKPLLVVKKKTDYGWHLIFHLPPGISFDQVKRKKNYFADAIKGSVDLYWNGALHMDIQMQPLADKVKFEWNPAPYIEKMNLPFPAGHSHNGLEVTDLSRIPHLLIGGVTDSGKTNFLRGLIAALLPMANIALIDLKGLDFYYLRNHLTMVETLPEVLQLLSNLNEIHDARVQKLRKAKAVKIQNYSGDDLPFLVCIIDEVAELDKEHIPYINRLVRLSRATGISIVAATQRPSVQVLDGDTRSQFMGRLCFPVASEIDSRMILGEEHSEAAWLPAIKGRAIFKNGLESKQVQTMFLDDKVAEKMLNNMDPRRWEVVDQQIKPVTQKRFRPR